MYKIIFIDIDGTLRNNDKVITDRVRKSIEKIKSLGILVVLCTGRPRGRTIDFVKESNASRYLITSGGSEIYDMEEDKIIYDNPIPQNLCLEINKIIEKYNLIYYINSNAIRAVNHKMRLYGNELIIDNAKDFIINNRVQQIVLNSSSFKTMLKVEKEINLIKGLIIPNHSKCLDNTNLPISPLMYCDIVEQNTSKGQAIKILCQYLGIEKEQVVGIGDNKNDISMFNEVGLRVAMENGIKELKDISDIIAPANYKDGVAIFLEDLYMKVKGN